jgi:hypothetical protein
MFFKNVFIISVVLFSIGAHASDGLRLTEPTDWDSFNKSVDEVDRLNESTGLAYMISGAAVAVGAGIIKNQSSDTLTNLTLSLIQSVGVGGIGYGAGLYELSEPNEIFRNTLLMQHDLTLDQKNEMTRNYLGLKKDRQKKKRIIAALTYGLIAILNTFNATQTSDPNLKTIDWALAGANLALSLSFTF